MLSADSLVLSDLEQRHKAAYLSDRDKILFAPLSFEDYSRVIKEEEGHLDYRDFYQETSRDGKGLTISRSKLYETTDIFMSQHPRYSYPILHNHEFVELIYVMSGTCINYINGKAITMKKGDLCFMAPSTVHALLSVSDNDVIFNILLWEDNFSNNFPSLLKRDDQIAQFFKQIPLATNNTPYMIFHTGNDKAIEESILASYQEFVDKKNHYIEMISLKINEIFIELGRSHLPHLILGNAQEQQTDAYVYPIVSFIQMNYQTISLKELATIFSYSEAYLSKLIKKKTGQTFKEIVEIARIEDAKSLVLSTDYTLTEISQRTGYFDSSHMNRDFIKRLGLPPKKWLQTMQENKETGN